MQGRDIAIVVGAVVLVILLVVLMGGGAMMGPGMMGWGYGFGPVMWLVMLLFWGLIIGGIALLLLWLFRQGRPAEGPGGGPEPRAIEILRERYARGEITRDEYEQVRRDLEDGR